MRDSGPHPRNAPVCKKTMQAQYTDPATSGVTDRFAPLNVDFETMCDITSMCAYVLDVCVHANSSLSKCIQEVHLVHGELDKVFNVLTEKFETLHLHLVLLHLSHSCHS